MQLQQGVYLEVILILLCYVISGNNSVYLEVILNYYAMGNKVFLEVISELLCYGQQGVLSRSYTELLCYGQQYFSSSVISAIEQQYSIVLYLQLKNNIQ